MNKFEQLIEYVINDDEAKAKELFHEIVVEKSRGIWENLKKLMKSLTKPRKKKKAKKS
jgi:riboflavin synthase